MILINYRFLRLYWSNPARTACRFGGQLFLCVLSKTPQAFGNTYIPGKTVARCKLHELPHGRIKPQGFKENLFWDWFIQFGSLAHHWKYEPTYLVVHFLFLFGGVATFAHAYIRGGRLLYLWLGTVLHGLVVECLCYILPDVDNFWHSQTPVMLLGRRLPLHILFLYPCFIYNSSIGVAKLRLPRWAEPFAVGLGSVLVDSAYDIISINFLHWTWHDTDPNIGDRFYWVPWNSFYFHSCFAASFTFWFHLSRKLICRTKGKWEPDSVLRELICTIIAALLGTPGGVLMFIPVYHPLHDIYKIHSEVTYFFIFSIFLLIIWTGDRTARANQIYQRIKPTFHWSNWILLAHLILHYSSFLAFTLFFKPEDEVAIGLKEPIGPCDQHVPIQTAFGMVLQKRKYLCATDYDEQYFDWKCLPNGEAPSSGSIWYTACAVPAPNMVELTCIALWFFIVASGVYGNLHFNSYGDDVFDEWKVKAARKVNVQKKTK